MDTEALQDLTVAIKALKTDLDRRHAQNSVTLEEVSVKVDKVLLGFPEGDPESHRRFHEAVIEQAKAREKFWREISLKLVEKGIWAAMIFLVAAAGFYLKAKLTS